MVLNEKEIKKLVEEVLNEIDLDILFEAPIVNPKIIKQKSNDFKNHNINTKIPKKKIIKKTPSKPVIKPKIKPKIKPDLGNIENKKLGEPKEKSKDHKDLSKVQYQIFNIKMRLGKLGLGDTVRRFTQSIHDFDINVTKNSLDENDIRSYLSPAQGNLVALKGALESLEAEFDELDKLLDQQ